MTTKEPDAIFSRRNLLMTSAKLTVGAVAVYGTGTAAAVLPEPAEKLPEVTEEIAGYWTTF